MHMLATPGDVEKRLGRALDDSEPLSVQGLIEEASEMVVGYLGRVPNIDDVRVVVSRMVARVLEAPDDGSAFNAETASYAAGPFSQNVRFASGASGGAPWLTASDKLSLRRLKRRGIYTIGITR